MIQRERQRKSDRGFLEPLSLDSYATMIEVAGWGIMHNICLLLLVPTCRQAHGIHGFA